MKFATAALAAGALFAASVSSVPVRRDVPVDLVPQFGVRANVNPTGTGYALSLHRTSLNADPSPQ